MVLQIPAIVVPEKNAGHLPASWLTRGQVQLLSVDSPCRLSCLAVLFGYIATVRPSTIVQQSPGGRLFYLDSLLPCLLSHGMKWVVMICFLVLKIYNLQLLCHVSEIVAGPISSRWVSWPLSLGWISSNEQPSRRMLELDWPCIPLQTKVMAAWVAFAFFYRKSLSLLVENVHRGTSRNPTLGENIVFFLSL